MLCGSTMRMVGCAGETEWAIEKPSIPPIFSSVHILAGLLTVLEMYSWVGWRCHNPLAVEGERDCSLGQRGEKHMLQLLCSTNADEWAWTGNVTAVNILSQGGLSLRNCIWFITSHQGQCSSLFSVHTCIPSPPPTTTLASRWKKKMAELQRLILCHWGNWSMEAPWWNLTTAATS